MVVFMRIDTFKNYCQYEKGLYEILGYIITFKNYF